MGLLSKIFSNTRKPEGFFGKMMVNGMNGGGHAQMANWALSSVSIKEDDQILDIGCGGGANIARLLQRTPKGVVQGIDYSPVSVAKSSKVNAKAIAEGRCKVQEASVVKLPFGENTFDLITAFETIYFWPDIEHCFGEVKRCSNPVDNLSLSTSRTARDRWMPNGKASLRGCTPTSQRRSGCICQMQASRASTSGKTKPNTG